MGRDNLNGGGVRDTSALHPRPFLSERITDIPLLVLEQVDSTNLLAIERAKSGDFGPLWILAKRQTAGRGRQGRIWKTGEGNFSATFLVRVDGEVQDTPRLGFIVALGLAKTLDVFIEPSLIRLKWPNDIFVNGAKIGGILIESGRVPASQAIWLAIGIGLNLVSYPDDLAYPATCLADHLPPSQKIPPSPHEVLQVLHRNLIATWKLWQSEGFETIAGAWQDKAWGLGSLCSIRSGQEVLTGVAEGLESDGALRLRLADGSYKKIYAGDVTFLRGEA